MNPTETPTIPRHIKQLVLLCLAQVVFCVGMTMFTDTQRTTFLRDLLLGSLVPATIGTILIVKASIEERRQKAESNQ